LGVTARWVQSIQPVARRRYNVGYALADGNTYSTGRLPFYRLSMAEKYADWVRVLLTKRWHTCAVFITDLDNEERGNVYGTEED
jgi:hypothetical protein